MRGELWHFLFKHDKDELLVITELAGEAEQMDDPRCAELYSHVQLFFFLNHFLEPHPGIRHSVTEG